MIGFDHAFANYAKITELSGVALPTRVRNGLVAEGIYTLEQFLRLTMRDMLKIPNLGVRSQATIAEAQKALRLYYNEKAGLRIIVSAACRFRGELIIAAPRHFDPTMQTLMDLALKALGITDIAFMHEHEEGFIDQFGVFMDRVEALKVATASGQLNRYRIKRGHEKELFSEDLY